jgi:hypothetical protein
MRKFRIFAERPGTVTGSLRAGCGSAKVTFEDICPPGQFVEEHPHLFNQPNCPKMEYLMRTCHLNGLSDCGAVIEPVQRRPMIVKPKFLEWLLKRKNTV